MKVNSNNFNVKVSQKKLKTKNALPVMHHIFCSLQKNIIKVSGWWPSGLRQLILLIHIDRPWIKIPGFNHINKKKSVFWPNFLFSENSYRFFILCSYQKFQKKILRKLPQLSAPKNLHRKFSVLQKQFVVSKVSSFLQIHFQSWKYSW